jgi:hypothetical protein
VATGYGVSSQAKIAAAAVSTELGRAQLLMLSLQGRDAIGQRRRHRSGGGGLSFGLAEPVVDGLPGDAEPTSHDRHRATEAAGLGPQQRDMAKVWSPTGYGVGLMTGLTVLPSSAPLLATTRLPTRAPVRRRGRGAL